MDLKTVPTDLLIDSGRKIDKPFKNDGQSADKSNAALKKAAKDFEALFASIMVKSMRSTVGKDKITGGGQGEEIYRSMLDQEYANIMAGQGLGLAKVIERQFKEKK